MAQFTPSKKTIKDFNDGEEYLNRIDVVQADTVNNLVEGLLYAQENGGGTTMLTEGRESGKTLRVNDYYLYVLSESSGGILSTSGTSLGLKITNTNPTLSITKESNNQYQNKLKIGK